MPLIAGAVIGGIDSIFKIGTGIGQKSKANRMEQNNKRPVFEIQKEYLDNQGLSSSMAQRGLSEKALDYYTTETQRGFEYGTDNTLQLGGSVNSINALYDNYNRGLKEIAVKDAELQNQNIKYLIDRNKELAAQKVQQWVINKYEPYKDTAKAIAQMRSAGDQNISTGLSQAAGVATSLSTAGQNKEMLNTPNAKQVTQQVPSAHNTPSNTAAPNAENNSSMGGDNYINYKDMDYSSLFG
jgi:hypothetical protein